MLGPPLPVMMARNGMTLPLVRFTVRIELIARLHPSNTTLDKCSEPIRPRRKPGGRDSTGGKIFLSFVQPLGKFQMRHFMIQLMHGFMKHPLIRINFIA